jgi:uncharacterized membrane protein
VLLFQREDKLAVYHAKQSLVLALVAIGTLVGWFLGTWVISWIPLVGPLLAAAMFSQVILIWIFLAVTWIMGMVYALQAKKKALPLIGKWANQLPV